MVIDDENLKKAIIEIRDLLRLLAEPAIANRDSKLRDQLHTIVGSSAPKAKATRLLDGSQTQAAIHKITGIHKGQLSDLVKELSKANLLEGDPRQPRLVISIPANFFEGRSAK